MRVGGETLVLNLCTEYLFYLFCFFFVLSSKRVSEKKERVSGVWSQSFCLCPAVEREAGDSELCPMITQKKNKIKMKIKICVLDAAMNIIFFFSSYVSNNNKKKKSPSLEAEGACSSISKNDQRVRKERRNNNLNRNLMVECVLAASRTQKRRKKNTKSSPVNAPSTSSSLPPALPPSIHPTPPSFFFNPRNNIEEFKVQSR